MLIPVIDSNNKPLMPCRPSRARWLLKNNRAKKHWIKSIFCIKILDRTEADCEIDVIAVGIDPGSKFEAFTVKSERYTYLNVQTKAVTWVKDRMTTRSQMRRTRRGRNTPYREARFSNRKKSKLAPSTKARWGWKLRVINLLSKLYPIHTVVVEDIKARTMKNGKKWNLNFSPLEVGKSWFYEEIAKEYNLETLQGYDTFEERNKLGLKKSKNKSSTKFNSHCVDSWTLANWFTGGHLKPETTKVTIVNPLKQVRRQLHKFQPAKGGDRQRVGGTNSQGFIKGSIVKHRKTNKYYLIGGSSDKGVDLLDVKSGVRSKRFNKIADLEQYCYNSFAISQA